MPSVGEVFTKNNCLRTVCLLVAQTANNGAPTLATQGVPTYLSKAESSALAADAAAGFQSRAIDAAQLAIRSVAGSGVMVGTFTLWGYLAQAGAWFAIPVAGGTGLGTALAEDGVDTIFHRETFEYLYFDRLYLELSAVGGTATAFDAYLTVARPGM